MRRTHAPARDVNPKNIQCRNSTLFGVPGRLIEHVAEIMFDNHMLVIPQRKNPILNNIIIIITKQVQMSFDEQHVQFSITEELVN